MMLGVVRRARSGVDDARRHRFPLRSCCVQYELGDLPCVLRYVGDQCQFPLRHPEQASGLASLWLTVGLATGEKGESQVDMAMPPVWIVIMREHAHWLRVQDCGVSQWSPHSLWRLQDQQLRRVVTGFLGDLSDDRSPWVLAQLHVAPGLE